MLLIWNSIVWVSLACSRLETLFGSQSVLKRRLLPGKVLARGTRGDRKVMAVYRAKGFGMGCQGSVFCGTQTVYLTNPMLWPMSETMENPQKPLSFHAYGNVV